MAGGVLRLGRRARHFYAVAVTYAKPCHLFSSEDAPREGIYGAPPSGEQLHPRTHQGRTCSEPAAYSPSSLPSVVLHCMPASGISAAVRTLCGWLCDQMLTRPLYLTSPTVTSPQYHGLLDIQRKALSSAARPVTAHFQRVKSEVVEETQVVRKNEHPERHIEGHFEQEAQGPFHDKALGASQGSSTEEEPWTRGHSVGSSSGGERQADAAEVASIVDELWKLYPNRRRISPATRAFVGTLLEIRLTKPKVCNMFRKDRKVFARSSEALMEQRKLLARHGVSAAGFRDLLQRHTWWLSKPLQEVERTVLYVERLLGGPGEAAARVFTVNPNLLTCNEANLEEKVQALQLNGVRDVARVITKFSDVLSHYTAQGIANKIAALKGALGTGLATELLERRPAILRANTNVMLELLAWLEKTFGRAAALRMVALEPRVAGAKVETTSATYAGLVGTFGEALARRMLLVHPGLLQITRCTLDAKLDFLTQELGHTLDEVASCARVLTAGLEGRLRPRAAVLQAAGKAHSSLSSLARDSDKEFERVYGVCLRQTAVAGSEAETSQGSRDLDQPHLDSIR